ncbi:hypothetical protein RFI_21084 [Reticulomyxa filosa]|uniref:Uncharacterized protein n=1 Tax=Reticulomyxa filosa TaxID=46433 RepID=X6MQY0_RETFI|nr:hypothetical protein RFI_21084 [Reticulomyxa filosa]|eukprot:ETO16269.1 hypothetical protein RFI_21084 [Reticulomyxa filosa]
MKWKEDKKRLTSNNTSIAAVIGIAFAQQSCTWYHWGDNDWAPSNQNFSQSKYAQTHAHSYFDSNDFAEGGYFYGKKWEEVFFSNPYYYRPLGFRYGILGAWNVPTICINATGGGNYKVELMAYSFTPGASLAASDLGTDPFNLQANSATNVYGQSKLYQCFMAPTNSQAALLLVFICIVFVLFYLESKKEKNKNQKNDGRRVKDNKRGTGICKYVYNKRLEKPFFFCNLLSPNLLFILSSSKQRDGTLKKNVYYVNTTTCANKQ